MTAGLAVTETPARVTPVAWPGVLYRVENLSPSVAVFVTHTRHSDPDPTRSSAAHRLRPLVGFYEVALHHIGPRPADAVSSVWAWTAGRGNTGNLVIGEIPQ